MESENIQEKRLKTFIKIADFVSQLEEVYGKKYHEIALYNRLIERTPKKSKIGIKKQIEIFTEFFIRNEKALLERDSTNIISNITYSSKAFLDIKKLLEDSDTDSDTKNTIWNHLLVIHATIDPSSKSKEILKSLLNNSNTQGDESQFLTNFLSKVENSIDKEQASKNPLAAATSLLQSGMLGDLMGSIDNGVKSGKLDITKLLGSVQGMLGNLTSQMENDKSSSTGGGNFDIGSMMSMITNMTTMAMGNSSGNGVNPMSQITQMLGSLTINSSSSSSSSSVNDIIPQPTGLDPEKALEQIEHNIEQRLKEEKSSNSNITNIDDPE